MTAYSAVDHAIESIKSGAYHYLTKPFKVDEFALFLDRTRSRHSGAPKCELKPVRRTDSQASTR